MIEYNEFQNFAGILLLPFYDLFTRECLGRTFKCKPIFKILAAYFRTKEAANSAKKMNYL